jgi:hypothetical protein
MDKHTYNKLATKLGHNHIHFTVIKDGKVKINKRVEAK